MNHVLKYTTSSIGASLQKAFGTILSDMLYKKSTGFVTLSGLSKWNDLDFVCQSNPILPCLFNLTSVSWKDAKTALQVELDAENGLLPVTGMTNTIDIYTLIPIDKYIEVDEITKVVTETDLPIARICGGYVLGNFTNVLFPNYDPAQDNMLTDVMAASVASVLKGDYQSSYAYLRFGQMLQSFAKENMDTRPIDDSNKRNYVPKLFKL